MVLAQGLQWGLPSRTRMAEAAQAMQEEHGNCNWTQQGLLPAHAHPCVTLDNALASLGPAPRLVVEC